MVAPTEPAPDDGDLRRAIGCVKSVLERLSANLHLPTTPRNGEQAMVLRRSSSGGQTPTCFGNSNVMPMLLRDQWPPIASVLFASGRCVGGRVEISTEAFKD